MARRTSVLLLLLLSLAVTPAVSAQEGAQGGVAVVPAEDSEYAKGQTLLIEGVRPGEVVEAEALVVNTTDEPVRVVIYPADGLPAEGGGFGYTARNEPDTGVGAWLRLPVDELTVPAQTQLPLDLRLEVGPDAFDGRNVGAVVVEPLDQESGTGQLVMRTRYAMPVTVVVTGGRARPLPETSPTPEAPPAQEARVVQLRELAPGARGDRLCPTVVVGNAGTGAGTVMVRAEAEGLLGSGGSSRTQVELPAPASTRQVELDCVERPLGPGRVSVYVEGQGEELDEDLWWVPGPLYLSLLLLLLLLGALVTTFLRGARRRTNDSPARTPI